MEPVSFYHTPLEGTLIDLMYFKLGFQICNFNCFVFFWGDTVLGLDTFVLYLLNPYMVNGFLLVLNKRKTMPRLILLFLPLDPLNS